MKAVVRTLGELGAEVTLAPERYLAASLGVGTGRGGAGVRLGELVTEARERVVGAALARAVALDTTHARDGVLDVPSARAAHASAPATSPKKRVREGDLLVSRLRPYLRQIALAHPSAMRSCGPSALACSTEFYVLRPRAGDDLAFLVPFLLGAAPQAALAAGQEGGHHPRVPLETLLALEVPRAVVRARAKTGRAVRAALAELYAATARYRDLIA